jgi:hypothetical protein
MKKIKILVAAVLLCSMLLSLCACSVKKEDVIGAWSATYTYQGNEYACMFTLSDDGNYHYVSFKNGVLSTIEDGTFEINGSKVVLHRDGNEGVSRTYKAKGEHLVNNGHEFSKGELDMSLFNF